MPRVLLRPPVVVLTLAALVALVAVVALVGPVHAEPSPAEERVALATELYGQAHARHAAGGATTEEVYRWSVRWLESQRDQKLKGKALAAALSAHVERMRTLETEVGSLVERGRLGTADRALARYARLEAEAWAKAAR